MSTLATLLDLLGEELELSATPIDYGHDRTLTELNLRNSPEVRIERLASWSRGMRELQRSARG